MSHRLWVNSPRFGVIGSDQSPHRVYCTAFPFCHVSGFGALMQVMTGASALVLSAMFEPTEMLAMCEAHRATAIGLVPTMAIRLMDDPTFAQRDLSSLRAIYCGGTHTQPELVRRIEAAFGAPVYVAYGQSESPWITMTSAEDTDAEKAESVGRPTWHRAVKIADPVTSVPVPIGDVGELCTRSPMVMSGYVGAAADESAVDAEGWLRTGDLCSMNERGVISFRGRTREVIIRGGENVYPIEVERVIVQQAAVAEVAVAGWPDPEWGEIVVAFVRLEGGATADVEALERFCRSELASFKVPRQWVFLDAFPTTAAGKIKKGELKLDNEKGSPDE